MTTNLDTGASPIVPPLSFGVEIEFVMPDNPKTRMMKLNAMLLQETQELEEAFSGSELVSELDDLRANFFWEQGKVLESLSKGILESLNKENLNAHYGSYHGEQNMSSWFLCYDGSAGWEMVSPVLRHAEGLIEVMRMCEALQKMDAFCTADCGLHVHVDASMLNDEERANLVVFHHRLEQDYGLLNCLAATRRNNSNCQATSNEILENANTGRISLDELSAQDRFRSLNFRTRNGTVEFRRHEGTTCFYEVLSWILLCLFLVTNPVPANHAKDDTSLSEAVAVLGMLGNDDLVEWAARSLLERQDIERAIRGERSKRRLVAYLEEATVRDQHMFEF